ncbi:MAG: hypothetical protein ACREMY_09990 [bacterium]
MAISVPLYTVDDLEKFPKDGNRYELLDGVLVVTPEPAAVHQVVVSRIQVKLAYALDKLGHVVGPGAVVVDLRQVFAGFAAESWHESES